MEGSKRRSLGGQEAPEPSQTESFNPLFARLGRSGNEVLSHKPNLRVRTLSAERGFLVVVVLVITFFIGNYHFNNSTLMMLKKTLILVNTSLYFVEYN